MIIEESDFKMEYDESCDRWDLYLLKTINAKVAEKKREELKLWGYSMSLDNAVNKIIRMRLANKLDVVDLKTYIHEYRKGVEEIKRLCTDKTILS